MATNVLTPGQWRMMGPGPCLHRLHLPWERTDCLPDCPGRQENGVCLAELVQAANEQDVPLEFDVRPQVDIDLRYGGLWEWAGAPVEVPVMRSPHEPPDPDRVIGSYVCPHCGAENQQTASNFHYWCAGCGRNATEFEREEES